MSNPRPELLRLLSACKAEPDDDHARLVLADWLEEHGDEHARRRAAFVRLDVTSGGARGRPEFTHLRRQMWDENSARWAPFQAALRKSSASWPLRGLVEAHATGKSPTMPRCQRWADTEHWAWVERLWVHSTAGDMGRVMGSPLLRTLGALAFDGGKEGLEALAVPALALLRGLRLQGGSYGDAGLVPLLESPHAAGLRLLGLKGALEAHD